MKSSVAVGMMLAAILLSLSLGVGFAQDEGEIPNLTPPEEMNVTNNLILFPNMTLNVIMIENMTTINTNVMMSPNMTSAKNMTQAESMTKAALMISNNTIEKS